ALPRVPVSRVGLVAPERTVGFAVVGRPSSPVSQILQSFSPCSNIELHREATPSALGSWTLHPRKGRHCGPGLRRGRDQEIAEMPSNNSMTVLQTIGNYDLVEKIAEGGMGAIYKGRHRLTGQTVAVKIMPPHMANNPVLLKRFEQEFRAASRLDHPNIV